MVIQINLAHVRIIQTMLNLTIYLYINISLCHPYIGILFFTLVSKITTTRPEMTYWRTSHERLPPLPRTMRQGKGSVNPLFSQTLNLPRLKSSSEDWTITINGSLNKDKELNLTTNHRSPRSKRFVNHALKTGTEGVSLLLCSKGDIW
jgi:hypothetical protein